VRTLKLTLSYDGTRLVGWQRQAEGESVQGVLEDALAHFEGAPVTVHGAGRTDAGVHALGQVASARVTFAHDATTLARALNAQLPEDVRVLGVEEVPADFHARFSARAKTYRYLIRNARGGGAGRTTRLFRLPQHWHRRARRRPDVVRVGCHRVRGGPVGR
jgi:tRNA pseudouridine38-40 synthase